MHLFIPDTLIPLMSIFNIYYQMTLLNKYLFFLLCCGNFSREKQNKTKKQQHSFQFSNENIIVMLCAPNTNTTNTSAISHWFTLTINTIYTTLQFQNLQCGTLVSFLSLLILFSETEKSFMLMPSSDMNDDNRINSVLSANKTAPLIFRKIIFQSCNTQVYWDQESKGRGL